MALHKLVNPTQNLTDEIESPELELDANLASFDNQVHQLHVSKNDFRTVPREAKLSGSAQVDTVPNES